jgi:hypothetical protein
VNGSYNKQRDYGPHVFSRKELELTFKLLRNYKPSLALAIQNVLVSDQIPDAPDTNPANDHFYVNIEARTIGKIVGALTEMGQKTLVENPMMNERQLIIGTLMREWMTLAEWIIMQANHLHNTRETGYS